MQENTAIISLKNIRHNISVFRSLLPPQTAFIAVVKANAYGHGAERVAESVENLADGFAVTDVAEGIALRFYIKKPVLVLTPPLDEEDVFLAVKHSLTLTVCNFSSLRILSRAAEKYDLTPIVHLKVDTGMNRLGLHGGAFRNLCLSAVKNARIRVSGIYSHLYAPQDSAAREEQRKRFICEKEVAENIFGKLTAHLAATGGATAGERFAFDAVRVGLGIYGYLPDGLYLSAEEAGLRPAMKLYTHTLQTHSFSGGGIGYRRAERTYGSLTAYRVGYADGFPRNGRAGLAAEGTLCMDGCISERRGIYGKRKLIFSNAAKVAAETGTIVYETLCDATRRARIEYVE